MYDTRSALKKIFSLLCAVGACLSLAQVSLAEEEKRLEEIVVTEKRLLTPTKQTAETVYTGTEITRKGLDVAGVKAETNVYDALDLLPGVNVEDPDAYGLGAEQTNVRIRGVRGYLGAMTVEGIPNYGGNPMGPRAYVYDTENLNSIAVYKGAVPVDLGADVGDRGGAIDLRPLWAFDRPSARIAHGLGAFDYQRTYARLDSGVVPASWTKISISYSYTEADKWKGPGDLGPRNNINFTLVQPVGGNLEVKLWLNFNDQDMDKYYALTYDEAKSLGRYYRKDFNSGLTGDPKKDQNYFEYNRAAFTNREYFAFLTYKFSNKLKATIKPYISTEDAKLRDGASIQGKPGMQARTRDIDRKGAIADLIYDTERLKAVLGYHYESSDMDIYTENYLLTQNGLQYRGYGVFATTGTTYVNGPYLRLSGRISVFDWQAGVKYFRFRDSSSQGYVTDLVKQRLVMVRAPDLDRKAKNYDIWLPAAGLAYNLTENQQVYLNYGKNFIRPYAYLPLVSYYNQNRAAFQKARVTLADLFDGYDIEESDTFGLGMRIKNDMFGLAPTFYFSRHKNVLTVVSDPKVIIGGNPASYQQNIGDATGYGLDCEIDLFLNHDLTLFVNPTYNRLTYDDDISFQSARLDTKDKQVVDTPIWLVKTGIIWEYGGLEVIPQIRYLGRRYGDAEHKESISPYAVVDLRANYTIKRLWTANEARFGLEFYNIFDKKYVAVINAMDDSRAGGTSYLAGAPFTALATLSLEF